MREGILEQLPKTLPGDKVVLLVGPAEFNGRKGLKTLIDQLNRDEDWIKAEFRKDVSFSQVTSKVAVILTMVSTTVGTLTNMRRAAASFKTLCLNQALTIGEVKKVLQQLAELRVGLPGSETAIGYNGAHKLQDNWGNGSASVAALITEPEAEFEISTPVSTFVATAALSTPAVDDITVALNAMDDFATAFAKAQDAVLVIADQMKNVIAERDEFRLQINGLKEKNAALQDEVSRLVKENGVLTETNRELASQANELQQSFDNFERLIQGVRKSK